MSVRLALRIIVNGLRNRIRLAIKQKEHLKLSLGKVSSVEKCKALFDEVQTELMWAIHVVTHFAECDDTLPQLMCQAGKSFQETIALHDVVEKTSE